MSFLEYQRQELELRISKFEGECDQAVDGIRNLKMHARSFLEMLPCDRTDLKRRFLWCTRQLDEFMYLISEFNLSLSKLEENDCPKTEAPNDGVLTPMKNGQCETNPSAAGMCPKTQTSETGQAHQSTQIQTKPAHQTSLDKPASTELTCLPKQTIMPKQVHQTGQSNWREESQMAQTHRVKQAHRRESQKQSVQADRAKQTNWRVQASHTIQADRAKQENETEQASRSKQGSQAISRSGKIPEEKLLECTSLSENVAEKITDKNGTDKDVCPGSQEVGLALPPQRRLTSAVSRACVASADGVNLWLVTDMAALSKLINEMTEYYNKHQVPMEDLTDFSCCAYYDEETSSYFRGIYIRTEGIAEVFLVDTGESRPLAAGRMRALAARFCAIPALAHCCHLADIDINDEELAEKQATFLSQHLWEEYRIGLHTDSEENNSSGVYLYLDDGTTINELLARQLASTKPQLTEPHIASCRADEESQLYDRQFQGSKQDNPGLGEEHCEDPEYENPLEAVTGYSNRDEMDICKHYRGGADKTCFKGPRCKKRHVLQHPDGWTLDRVPVVATCRPAPLPAPGTSCKVMVTHVRDVGCFFVQLEQKDETMTLAELVEEMTRDAAKAKPLKILPALGELVSARFSDGRWYRARVTACADDAGHVEVMFIDYGNESTVAVTSLRALQSRWLSPAAAVRCRLAGAGRLVTADRVVDMFTEMVLDRTLRAEVIARCYDELTVELIDLEGFNVAEQLAVMADIPLEPYQVEDDSHRYSVHLPA